MGILVNISDYKSKNMLSSVISSIVDKIYLQCMSNIKTFDVYSYIDLDILDLIESYINSIIVENNLKSDLEDYIKEVGGLYSYLHSLSYKDEDIDSNSILCSIIEDELTEMFLNEGYKVVLKFEGDEICVWDGELIIELGGDNVFDRIIKKVLDNIPYELIYIR